ncbi:MAG: sigma-54-dependent Fis family transcriptional regulator [Treponema sp.]|nr:sigma-54-dependent Fis family transcriptional regulator [Treponema sp.]
MAKSLAVLDVLRVIDEVAKTRTPVLFTGESGTGKELFAEQVHIRAGADTSFVRVNCMTAATGADLAKAFASADGGTVFLDEVAALARPLQETVLALLQKTSARVVAATSRDLERMAADGAFDRALFYCLNVLPLHIPPLRERKEDIAPLAQFFLSHFSRETKKAFAGFSPEAMQVLCGQYWPGNVRELKNTVERACMLETPPLIEAGQLGLTVSKDGCSVPSGGERTLKAAVTRFKAAYVRQILNETAWNQTKAGKVLGIQRTYLSRLLHELHIR